MAIRTVYNRDGSVYGELNTDDFLFNNNTICSEPIKLDVKLYPYVKIDGVFYVNDGEEWYTRSRSGDSASMMNVASSYKWNDNGTIKNVIDSLKSFYVSDTPVSGDKTSPTIAHGKITVPLLGSYGVGGNRFSYLSQERSDRWNKQAFVFKNSQPYGWKSGTNIKNWCAAETISREIVLENFTGPFNGKWIVNIQEQDNKTRLLTVTKSGTNTKYSYIVGDEAKIKLYRRTAGTPQRPISTTNFPNYIPHKNDRQTEKRSDYTIPEGYCYPRWDKYSWFNGIVIGNPAFTFDVSIDWIYSQKLTDKNQIKYLDYYCTCNTGKIYEKECSIGNFTIDPNASIAMQTQATCAKKISKTLYLGVLMEKYTKIPSSNPNYNIDQDELWELKGGHIRGSDDWSFMDIDVVNRGSYEYGNVVTGYQPRIRGRIDIQDYWVLDFLEDYEKNNDQVTIGKLTARIDNTHIYETGTSFIQIINLFRKFSLKPGIAQLSGMNLMGNGSDNWNRKRMSFSFVDTAGVWREYWAFHSHGNYSFDDWPWQKRTSYAFSSIGFEREGVEEKYAYCLTIEYPEE